MSLLSGDTLCRFIRTKDWSKKLQRPTPQAFKQPELSVWHKEWLDDCDTPLEQLRVGSLEGAGQAHHTVGDYNKHADELSVPLNITLAADKVPPALEQWGNAHYELFGPGSSQEFRNKLVASARVLVPPDDYRQ